MRTPPAQPQVNIFTDSQQQAQFAEICNALYERELHTLAHQSITNMSLLQRKLGGLHHHVKRVAYQFVRPNGPLGVDVHNATWQAKQSAHCQAAKKHSTEKTQAWFSQYARSGLAVVIYVKSMHGEHLELDSIDRIDPDVKAVHCNKFGWFTLSGHPQDGTIAAQHEQLLLLHPSKPFLVAASCGHTWDHKGRSQPRPLSLRELLLSGSINWKNFR